MAHLQGIFNPGDGSMKPLGWVLHFCHARCGAERCNKISSLAGLPTICLTPSAEMDDHEAGEMGKAGCEEFLGCIVDELIDQHKSRAGESPLVQTIGSSFNENAQVWSDIAP
jgi:hypothetical protein